MLSRLRPFAHGHAPSRVGRELCFSTRPLAVSVAWGAVPLGRCPASRTWPLGLCVSLVSLHASMAESDVFALWRVFALSRFRPVFVFALSRFRSVLVFALSRFRPVFVFALSRLRPVSVEHRLVSESAFVPLLERRTVCPVY